MSEDSSITNTKSINQSQDTAVAIAHDVQLFFDSALHSSSTQSGSTELLFNPTILENFYQDWKISSKEETEGLTFDKFQACVENLCISQRKM